MATTHRAPRVEEPWSFWMSRAVEDLISKAAGRGSWAATRGSPLTKVSAKREIAAKLFGNATFDDLDVSAVPRLRERLQLTGLYRAGREQVSQ